MTKESPNVTQPPGPNRWLNLRQRDTWPSAHACRGVAPASSPAGWRGRLASPCVGRGRRDAAHTRRRGRPRYSSIASTAPFMDTRWDDWNALTQALTSGPYRRQYWGMLCKSRVRRFRVRRGGVTGARRCWTGLWSGWTWAPAVVWRGCCSNRTRADSLPLPTNDC